MSRFIVVPFRPGKRQLEQAEPRTAKTADRACQMAELLSARFAGTIALEVPYDPETEATDDPRVLATFGNVPELSFA